MCIKSTWNSNKIHHKFKIKFIQKGFRNHRLNSCTNHFKSPENPIVHKMFTKLESQVCENNLCCNEVQSLLEVSLGFSVCQVLNPISDGVLAKFTVVMTARSTSRLGNN